MIGIVYIIQLPQHHGSNIFKFGRSKNLTTQRFQSYPVGTNIFFICACSDCVTGEEELLNMMKKNFTHRTNIGSEFFEGDVIEMINLVNTYTILQNKFKMDSFKTLASSIEDKEYKCDRCLYSTPIKCNMIHHLKRKIPCENVMNSATTIEEMLAKFKIDKSEYMYECELCATKFSSRSGYYFHKHKCENEQIKNNTSEFKR
jgi:hypothetical protein